MTCHLCHLSPSQRNVLSAAGCYKKTLGALAVQRRCTHWVHVHELQLDGHYNALCLTFVAYWVVHKILGGTICRSKTMLEPLTCCQLLCIPNQATMGFSTNLWKYNCLALRFPDCQISNPRGKLRQCQQVSRGEIWIFFGSLVANQRNVKVQTKESASRSAMWIRIQSKSESRHSQISLKTPLSISTMLVFLFALCLASAGKCIR